MNFKFFPAVRKFAMAPRPAPRSSGASETSHRSPNRVRDYLGEGHGYSNMVGLLGQRGITNASCQFGYWLGLGGGLRLPVVTVEKSFKFTELSLLGLGLSPLSQFDWWTPKAFS